MISEEKTLVQELQYIPEEVKLLQTEETYKMERVDGMLFVKNKTGKSYQITDHYVALL